MTYCQLAIARILGKTADVRKDAGDDPKEQVWVWLAVIVAALVTSAIAFLVTEARCGAVAVAGVVVSKSAYCHALRAPVKRVLAR